MKLTRNLIISLVCMTVTFMCLFFFRGVPVSRIWNNYTVVYVDKIIDEDVVLSYLERSGCNQVISLKQQKIPFAQEFVPVMPAEENEYLEKRLSYFFDKSQNYALYYVPRAFDSMAVRALENLVKERGVICGIDGKQQYPWVVPLITLLVFLFFCRYSENKMAFCVPAFFPLCFSFSQVFYPAAAVSILYMLALYFAQRVWMRKQAKQILTTNVYLLVCLGAAVLAAFFMSWQSALVMILCTASSLCSLHVLFIVERIWESRNSFHYTKIFQAPQLPLMYPKSAMHTLFCLFPLLIILVSFLLSARFTVSKNEKNITLPVPVPAVTINEQEETLPNLLDYQKWIWNVRSYPYKSLNTPGTREITDGTKITIPRFQETSEGIVYGQSSVMIFDDSFKENATKEIDKMDSSALENLLKKQDSDTKVVYSNLRNTQNSDGISLILILFCLFIPVLLLTLYSIKTTRKNRK